MVSRELRVYLTGLALAAAVGIATRLVPGLWPAGSLRLLAVYLVFPVLSFLLPQLYLAAVGSEAEDVPPQVRIRVGLFVSGLVTLGMHATAPPGTVGRSVLAAAAATLFVVLVGHEMLAGYRESSLFEDQNAE